MSTSKSDHETHESNSLFTQAVQKMSRNHHHEAMRHLEDALRISPANATYLSHYGLCVAIENEDYDSATVLCKRAVKASPKDTVLRVNLGRVLRMQGDNAQAHRVLVNAWNSNPRHPAPAVELTRMGVRKPPVLRFLPRSHWLNVRLGVLRANFERRVLARVTT